MLRKSENEKKKLFEKPHGENKKKMDLIFKFEAYILLEA